MLHKSSIEYVWTRANFIIFPVHSMISEGSQSCSSRRYKKNTDMAFYEFRAEIWRKCLTIHTQLTLLLPVMGTQGKGALLSVSTQ